MNAMWVYEGHNKLFGVEEKSLHPRKKQLRKSATHEIFIEPFFHSLMIY
jgi:hypothetical protein